MRSRILKLFKLSKVNVKGTVAIICLLCAIMVLFLAVLIPVQFNMVHSQVITSEKIILSELQTTIQNEIMNLTNISIYLSTIPLLDLGEDFTSLEYKSYLNIQNQIMAAERIGQQIEAVYLTDDRHTFSTMEQPFDIKALERDGEVIGSTQNIQLIKWQREDGCAYYTRFKGPLNYRNTVVFEIDRKTFSEQLFNNESNILGQGVFDAEGNIVLDADTQSLDQNAETLLQIRPDDEYLVETTDIAGVPGYLTTEKVDGYDLYLYQIADQNSYSEINHSMYIILLFVLLSLLLVFAVTVVICDITYRPFKKILDAFHMGNTVLVNQNDGEYTYILERINALQANNRELHDKMNETMRSLREQQLQVCQAQICPHFIANTLSAISSMSVVLLKDPKNNIAKSLYNLSSILHKALEINKWVTSIKEELQSTRVYVEILQMRYAGLFSVEWDIDQSLMEAYILKLSLQPMIENAATHAFSEDTVDPKIKVSIQKENGNICVKVQDNGEGIAPEALKNIRQNMQLPNTASARHIGLRNLNNRIKLLYGDAYCLTVQSELHKGTEISFTYPLIQGSKTWENDG